MSLELELHCFEVKSIKDTRIGTRRPSIEHASEILYSLRDAFAHPSLAALNARVLFMAYSDMTGVFPTESFSSRWLAPEFKGMRSSVSPHGSQAQRARADFDLLLLGKNKGFTAVSDWHDLQVMAFKVNPQSLPGLQKWVRIFHEEYMYYADRGAYNMVEPRPAVVEACIQTRGDVRVRYWTEDLITAIRSPRSSHSPAGGQALLRLVCSTGGHSQPRFGNPDEQEDVQVCVAAHYTRSLDYRRSIQLKTPDIAGMLVEVRKEDFATKLPWGMEFGSLRYRLGDAATGRPGRYCFDHSR
jgi:hypothetical protein